MRPAKEAFVSTAPRSAGASGTIKSQAGLKGENVNVSEKLLRFVEPLQPGDEPWKYYRNKLINSLESELLELRGGSMQQAERLPTQAQSRADECGCKECGIEAILLEQEDDDRVLHMAGILGPELLQQHPEMASLCFCWLVDKTTQNTPGKAALSTTGYVDRSLCAFELDKSELQALVDRICQLQPSEASAFKLTSSKHSQRQGQHGLLNRLAAPMLQRANSHIQTLPEIQRAARTSAANAPAAAAESTGDRAISGISSPAAPEPGPTETAPAPQSSVGSDPMGTPPASPSMLASGLLSDQAQQDQIAVPASSAEKVMQVSAPPASTAADAQICNKPAATASGQETDAVHDESSVHAQEAKAAEKELQHPHPGHTLVSGSQSSSAAPSPRLSLTAPHHQPPKTAGQDDPDALWKAIGLSSAPPSPLQPKTAQLDQINAPLSHQQQQQQHPAVDAREEFWKLQSTMKRAYLPLLSDLEAKLRRMPVTDTARKLGRLLENVLPVLRVERAQLAEQGITASAEDVCKLQGVENLCGEMLKSHVAVHLAKPRLAQQAGPHASGSLSRPTNVIRITKSDDDEDAAGGPSAAAYKRAHQQGVRAKASSSAAYAAARAEGQRLLPPQPAQLQGMPHLQPIPRPASPSSPKRQALAAPKVDSPKRARLGQMAEDRMRSAPDPPPAMGQGQLHREPGSGSILDRSRASASKEEPPRSPVQAPSSNDDVELAVEELLQGADASVHKIWRLERQVAQLSFSNLAKDRLLAVRYPKEGQGPFPSSLPSHLHPDPSRLEEDQDDGAASSNTASPGYGYTWPESTRPQGIAAHTRQPLETLSANELLEVTRDLMKVNDKLEMEKKLQNAELMNAHTIVERLQEEALEADAELKVLRQQVSDSAKPPAAAAATAPPRPASAKKKSAPKKVKRGSNMSEADGLLLLGNVIECEWMEEEVIRDHKIQILIDEAIKADWIELA